MSLIFQTMLQASLPVMRNQILDIATRYISHIMSKTAFAQQQLWGKARDGKWPVVSHLTGEFESHKLCKASFMQSTKHFQTAERTHAN